MAMSIVHINLNDFNDSGKRREQIIVLISLVYEFEYKGKDWTCLILSFKSLPFYVAWFMNLRPNLLLELLRVMCYSLQSCQGSLVQLGGIVSCLDSSGAGNLEFVSNRSSGILDLEEMVIKMADRVTLAAKIASTSIFNWQILGATALQSWVKFNIQITDPTASIKATVFPEFAEQLCGITGANITTTPGDPLSPKLLNKLAEPKKCDITLKAYMYTYAGIAQCKSNVHSMLSEPTSIELHSSEQPLPLPPTTPNKREKLYTASASASKHPTEGNPAKKPKLDSSPTT
ncbi:hypothetical protein RHMOL_Rhmol13G0190600 [Rhododendron molle]|nr:hypothetical protein RHMOL_Rhmol13G0190600 [Rhododendron molle]